MTTDELINALNVIEQREHVAKGLTKFPDDKWAVKKSGKKFTYLDCGTSGAFLLEHATGELFNIKGYGVPDYNKKLKANIGNLAMVNPEVLHRQRYNYLR